jgi:hypothetical protein
MSGWPVGPTIAATEKEGVVRHRVSHLFRDVAVIAAGIVVLALAGLIFVGYGFALAIVMVTVVAALALVPFASIYYEERDLPRDGRPGRA